MATEGKNRRPNVARRLLYGCIVIAVVLPVTAVGLLMWAHVRWYTGTLRTKSEVSSLAWVVRRSLSLLPEEAQDIRYAVRPYPPVIVDVIFRISERDFLRWMERNGWELQSVSRTRRALVRNQVEPNKSIYVTEGYRWFGGARTPLTLKGSYLQIEIVFDAARGLAYYEHLELLPADFEPPNTEDNGR